MPCNKLGEYKIWAIWDKRVSLAVVLHRSFMKIPIETRLRYFKKDIKNHDDTQYLRDKIKCTKDEIHMGSRMILEILLNIKPQRTPSNRCVEHIMQKSSV